MNYLKHIRGHYYRFVRTHFHTKKNKIIDGFSIFEEYADIYGNEISDIHVAAIFLDDFINDYGQCVNVDFLDTDNWDHIKKVEADFDKHTLTLYWHLPVLDEELRIIRKMAFPYDRYCLIIKFHSILFIRDNKNRCIGFIINGYTEKDKDIKKQMKLNGFSIASIDNNSSFFSTDIIRHNNNKESEFIRFMKTPITSFWIIPKCLMIQPQYSEKILYSINLQNCEKRLNNAINEVCKIKRRKTSKIDKEENLKQIGNSLRRIAENMFKLILCFHQEIYKFKPQDYNERLLGDIINPIKQNIYNTEEDKGRFVEIAIIANDLSHETGKPVTYDMLIKLHSLLLYYVVKFKMDIDLKYTYIFNSNDTKYQKPSPKEFIEKNYQSWDFTDLISSTIKETSGKLKFRLKFVRNGCFSFLKDDEYLCTDGKVRKKTLESEDCLLVWSRDELNLLRQQLSEKIETFCNCAGYAGNEAHFHFYFSTEIERVGQPVHLFSEEEIKDLMIEANDGVNNKLVIDENGYAHIIQEINLGNTYPVSQETWCAGNNYVGNKSILSDLHHSYVLSLHNWLIYLEKGHNVYGDSWKSDEKLDLVIEKIKTYYQ